MKLKFTILYDHTDNDIFKVNVYGEHIFVGSLWIFPDGKCLNSIGNTESKIASLAPRSYVELIKQILPHYSKYNGYSS